MKPGTPCVIEPTRRDDPTAQQLGGLVVVAKECLRGRYWKTAPPAMVNVPGGWTDDVGQHAPGGRLEVAVHEAWLRPLNGPSAADPTAEPRKLDLEEVPHG